MAAIITRRRVLAGAMAAGAGGLLTACDRLGDSEGFRRVLWRDSDWNDALQRSLSTAHSLAPQFRADQRSPRFRLNGSTNPDTPDYNAHAASGFADWRLVVDGLVARPLRLSLNDLAAMGMREQITLHNCVEGWSAIGGWAGPRLKAVLDAAGLKSAARFIVFHCADHYRGSAWPYYESIDLYDAFHPQTILALAMNGQRLSVGHGAPVRLRAERHLGYKQAKYVMRVEAVAALTQLYRGNGGYWEDAAGYEWFAGI